MFVTEHFLSDIVDEHDQHPVSTDGGIWYTQACLYLRLLNLFVNLHNDGIFLK